MSRADRASPVPAYGPLSSLLGFGAFYVFLTRATHTVVELVPTVLAVDDGAVRVGLAAVLWFVLAVTLIDQLRRQYRAATGDPVDDRFDSWVPVRSVQGLVVQTVVGAAISVVTFDPAVETGIALFRMVVTVDPSVLPPVGVVLTILFFVAFQLATRSLDRLVIDGVRTAIGTGAGV